ncbi:hypothetical protein BLA29_009887 [Euroglyphus maynei]|uniref:Uncharacterized protein n=1 Tax=Euroglyphus maynei TaxID=6958 RepID=A0A1Y3BS31_EURMA|nr:hypothetical protein BLA29_009887 [Euroglyphus maynei]
MRISYLLIIAIIWALILYISIKLFKFFRFHYRIYPHLKQIPGPVSSWLSFLNKDVGKILTSKCPFNDFFHIINSMADKYGSDGVFRFLGPPFAHVIVTDAIIAQKLLNNDDMADKSIQYGFIRSIILDNLFTW